MKNPLLEYAIHPFGTLKGIYNYHYDPAAKQATMKSRGERSTHRSYGRLNDYFDNLYQENRIQLYITYMEMDYDPLITKVLDSFGKSSAQLNSETTGEDSGKAVWVYSHNKTIKSILTNFLDTIQINLYASPILRKLFKLGDHYEQNLFVRNEGITGWEPWQPWDAATIWDIRRRISGFANCDDNGNPVDSSTASPFYQFLHFKMDPRYRDDLYGATSSILFNCREYWQELQWVEDKLMIERLRRRPDRVGILMDTTGMSAEDAFEWCEEVRRRLYRDDYFDPSIPTLSSLPLAMGEHRDLLIPTSGDNKTSFTNLPSSSGAGPMDDLMFFLRRFFGAVGFPPAYLGLDLGDSFNRDTPLEKQDVIYAQGCMGPQRSFLMELTRACMVHLIFLGIDPRLEQNYFSLLMTPVSVFQEIERKDLITMRYDLLDRALGIGRDNEWNMDIWTRYVMIELARMPEDFVETLIAKKKEEAATSEASTSEFNFENLDSEVKKRLEEEFERNPRAREVIEFVKNGGSSASSWAVLKSVILENNNGKKFIEKEKPISDFQKNLMRRLRERCKERKEYIIEAVTT